MIVREVNPTRIAWDLRRRGGERYDAYWKELQLEMQFLPPTLFTQEKPIWLEIGAGTGAFFVEMAKANPDRQLIAIERCKERGKRLLRKTEKSLLANLASFRGNAIPALINEIPAESIERIYILYPAPFARNSQRKNRWYLHPLMPHLVRILKKGGLLIWASDQEFYINEAEHVCRSRFQLETLAHGALAANPYNALDLFPEGRTKFERTFRAEGLTCHELVCKKL